MTSRSEAHAWARELDAVAERIAPRFRRVEPRQRAVAYLRGLLAPVERKNGWQLAEAAGDATPDGMQEFLSRMRWDPEAVRDDLRAYVVAHLGDAQAVLVVDETGFLKKGTKSAGVQRQYSGTAGRIENCQVGVFLAYASRHGHALIDRALYLPESWATDRARRDEAGVPRETTFATKPKLARAMLARAFAAQVPCAFVTGDSVYGADYGLRHFIETSGRGYVLAVTAAQSLGFKRVQDWLEDVPAQGWTRLSAGDGAKGPRVYDWAYLPTRLEAVPGWNKGLLIRRTPTGGEFTFYLTLSPAPMPLAALVQIAGTRWTIEACFEEAKGEVGLDEYEVRSWTGWHRHITLCLLAHAYLAVLHRGAIGGRDPTRPRHRSAADHRAGGAAPALAPDLGAGADTRRRSALVAMAAAPSAARPPLPLEEASAT